MDSKQLQPQSRRHPTRVVVAVGGLDPGGGAGLVRDVLAAAARGARVRVVATAFTEQSSAGVRSVEARAPAAVRDGLRAALAEERVRGAAVTLAVKVGMTATAAIAAAVIDALADFEGPVVVDPVLASSSGGRLFDGPPADLLPLVTRATLATPNLPEAAALAGFPAIIDLDGAAAAAERLRARGARAVLIKGGHLPAEASVADLLLSGGAGTARVFRSPRVPRVAPRGTGCALATAIAVELAGGEPVELAVDRARQWLGRQIAAAVDLGDERQLPPAHSS